jgi:serine/threonine-protein kinase
VWGDVAVTDDSLVQCLVEIRKSLGDDSVTTQRGRGYRFDRAVRPARGQQSSWPNGRPDLATAAPEPLSSASAPKASPPVPESRAWPRWPLWLGVSAIALAGIGLTAFNAHDDSANRAVVATMGESTNAEARREVAAGERLRRRPSRIEMSGALAHFERAAALDPAYAAAHVGISRVLTAAGVFGAVRPVDVGPRAKSAALRAIALNPTMSEAYVALAHSQVQHEWDWAGAEASYRKALALDPSNASGHQLYALLLGSLGRFDDAMRENSLGLVNASIESPGRGRSQRGILLYWARNPQLSIRELRTAIESEPALSLPRFWLALSCAQAGLLEDAMQSALASRESMGNQPVWVVGYVHAKAGRRAEALSVLRALEAQAEQTYVPATDMAFLHVGLGSHGAALTWLERGLAERSHWMETLAVHPVVDPLRGEPRFRQLLKTLALPSNLPSDAR